MTELPNTIGGGETPESRYHRCVRSYNVVVARYNSACDYLDAAQREYDDAAMWLDEACRDLNRAAAVLGWEGAPQP
jgi:hypothetical protein